MHRLRRKFVDSLRIYIQAGVGGNGFPKYGGIGGKGGDVFVSGKTEYTLKRLQQTKPDKRWRAGNGGHSERFCILGKPGKDLIIPVPLGTTVVTDLGSHLGELNTEGEKILVARGGPGGSSINQFSGQKGQMHHINLILKLIADVGLVGFPNAGKSTFLRAVSRATPKVASYPFTTLQPHIGVVQFPDHRQISIADLPGLVEGAWANIGMGHSFLRHIERTHLLLFMVDVNGFKLGPRFPYRSAIENVVLLNRELELYRPDLVEKPCLLVVNKMDCAGAEEKLKIFMEKFEKLQEVAEEFPEEMQPEQFVKFDDVIPCSAKINTDSVEYVKEKIRKTLDFYADQNAKQDEVLMRAEEKIKEELIEKNKQLI